MRHVTSAAITAVVLGTAMIAPAAARKEAGRFPSDKRLDQGVTVRRGYIYLGELLADLSRQTGVRLGVEGSKGPMDGILLTCFVHEVPLRDVMEGLAELESTKWNRWRWIRKGETPPRYLLQPQTSPAVAAAAAQRAQLETWKADLLAIRRAADLPAGPRSLALQAHRQVWPRGWDDKLPLLAALSTGDVRKLFAGKDVTLDVRHLSRPARAAFDRMVGDPSGDRAPNDGVPGLQIQRERGAVAPVLWLHNAAGVRVNLFAGPLWNNHWLSNQEDGWRGRGDPEVEAYAPLLVRGLPAAGEPLQASTVPRWLREVSSRQHVNVMADLVYPHFNESTGGAWLGKTDRQSMMALVLRAHLRWKPLSGRLQLLRDQIALTHARPHLVAWRTIHGWRQAADANRGYLDFERLIAVSRLTEPQLVGLSGEFPGLDFTGVDGWRAVFQFYQHLGKADQQQLRSEAGLRFMDADLRARRYLIEAPPTLVGNFNRRFLLPRTASARLSLRLEPVKPAGSKRRQGWSLWWRVFPSETSRPPMRHRYAALRFRLVKRRPLEKE